MPDERPDKTARALFGFDEPITNTRDRITAAALDMFYEHGFHAVGIDRIIREVGVTKTTFYNHFESKDALIVAAIRMRDRWETRAFDEAVARFSDGTPRGRILAIFDAMDLWFNGADYQGCLFITACAEFPSRHDPIHEAAATHYGRTTSALFNLCREAGADDPEALARQLELLVEGAVVMRLIKSDDTTAKSARAIAGALLERHCPAT